MSQTIQVNPVELATYLAQSQVDTLYQTSAIFYPYVDVDVDIDDDDTPLTYTPEGQKEFDSQYKWYHKVITSHERKDIVVQTDRGYSNDIEWDDLEGTNYCASFSELIGDYDKDKLVEIQKDYSFNFHFIQHEYYTIFKYGEQYIMEKLTDSPDYTSDYSERLYFFIKLTNL